MEIPNMFEARRQVRILRQVLLLLSLAIGLYSYTAYASRVSDKIYSVLQNSHYCSRRFNATHQMGCQSEIGGNLGIVWIVEDQVDLEHILKNGPTPPYVAILRRDHYTRKNLLDFKANTNRVSGVVFLDEDSKSRASPFSPDYQCPNKYSGLYSNDSNYENCKQNQWQQESPISGLLYDDIPYPIFLINDKKSIDDIEACFNDNNIQKGLRKQASYPLCGIQLDSFMLAAVNTKSCINSQSLVNQLIPPRTLSCAVVSSNNLVAYYKPSIGPLVPHPKGGNRMVSGMVDPKSVVVLAAKLSSISMFSEISPGADSTITSIVTLLAIADALAKVRNNTEVQKSNRNLAIALLDSEPFDYSGSSDVIDMMAKNRFPGIPVKTDKVQDSIKNMNLSSIDYMINLDQLANYPKSSQIYLHTDPRDKSSGKSREALRILQTYSAREGVKFHQSDPNLPLPPASVQEFIKHSQNLSDQLTGMVLSNYDKNFQNLFYHSIYDDSHNIYQTSPEKLVDHLTRVASFIAKSLYELTFKTTEHVDDIVVDKMLIASLLECYLKDSSCSLFTKACYATQQLPGGPIQTYKDPTKMSDDMNFAITKNLLVYLIGEKMADYNATMCARANRESITFNYEYLNGEEKPVKDEVSGVCYRSQVIPKPSENPAYPMNEEGEYDIDGRFPAWSVSYSSIRHPLRLYLEPSALHQWCVFFMGVVVTLASFLVVYQMRESISNFRKMSQLSIGTST